jgi:RNA polymerase sigma-70 factor (ECF subfamily)
LNQPELLDRWKQGDKSVFPELVEQGKDMVFNTALGIVQNEQDAEDITQEVFITLYEEIHNFRKESKLSTWLYRITIHKALDHERKKKRQKHGGLLKRIFSLQENDDPPNFNHPGVILDQKEQATILFRAISKLPDQQRAVFVLHKLEGLNNQEIAAILKCSLVAVESLQTRAKNNLRKTLKAYYEKEQH